MSDTINFLGLTLTRKKPNDKSWSNAGGEYPWVTIGQASNGTYYGFMMTTCITGISARQLSSLTSVKQSLKRQANGLLTELSRLEFGDE